MTEFMKYEALIADIARTLYRKTHLYDFEDLFQIGLQSAMRLDKSFDPERAKRTTFFTLCVRRDMLKFIKKHNKVFSNVSLPKEVEKNYEDQLWESIPDLDPEDKEMVNMIVSGHSKRDVAKRLRLPYKEIQKRLEKIGDTIG
jgi:RNA polymerase sigma factor (sigma-70 family)